MLAGVEKYVRYFIPEKVKERNILKEFNLLSIVILNGS
jgi:hypothetical protein